ncbi:serine/threonine-protein kinase [Streptomyces sp. NPDC033538]|uniref:serine/threonine-protein kinase n=1 Tax=Streptomyces sp. NPDC033538 TaxID=3155367 RepID=UPI0033FCA90A
MHSDGSAGGGSEYGSGMLIAHRYRLDKVLGRGGMGVVYEALDTRLDRKVAVKGLRHPDETPVTHAQWVSRARREAQAIARIEHQNVVAVHDVIEEGGQVWIVMELLNSRSLADLLKDQRQLAVPHAARIGLQVLHGLTAVHRAGVVHRDVKPHNILFRPDGRALLMDFGIATFEGAVQVTRTREIIGTAQYLAPELLSGARDQPRTATAASDLWALGVTLYEMVEGRRPFEGLTDLEVLIAVREAPVPPMRYAGPLAVLVDALLCKDPARRPDAAEAEQLLSAVTMDSLALDTQPGPRPPAEPVPPDSPPGPAPIGGPPPEPAGRGRPVRWRIPVAGLCAALLAAGAWFVWGQQGGSGERDEPVSGKPGTEKTYKDTDKDGTLVVGVKGDQPGLGVETGDDFVGFEPALAVKIADLMGYEERNVEFVRVTTADRSDHLVGDVVDIVVATYTIDEERSREEGVELLGPYYRPFAALLVKNTRYGSLDELQDSENSVVCTTRDSVYGDVLKKYGLTPKKNPPDTFEKCIEYLKDSRNTMDAVATDDAIANGYVSENPAWKTLLLDLDRRGWGIGVKKSEGESNRLLKRDVCRALSEIMEESADGKSVYRSLYDEYLKGIQKNRSTPGPPPLEHCADYL